MMRGVGKWAVRVTAIFCASILLFPTMVSAAPFNAPGDGSASHPYLITTCQQLQDAGNILNAHYKLMRHIDCSTFGTFSMIGNFFASEPFTGVLDGNGYSIIGLASNLGGPFGYTSGATIKNLQLRDSVYSISASIWSGTLIDIASNTTLINVHSSVTMNGSAPQAGGLIGSASNTTISKSSFTGTIGVSGSSINGGLAAIFRGASGVISDSYSHGTLSSASTIGGLIGYMSSSPSTVTRSYSASTLGHASGNAGGLVGTVDTFSPMPLSDSFSASILNGGDTNIGGIIGEIGMETPTGTMTYYDNTRAGGIGACAGNTPPDPFSCTAINTGGAQPDYFKTTSTNAPISAWDFSTSGPWQTRAGDYPELRSKILLRSSTFIDNNGDTINDQTQGTVNSGADSNGGAVTFVLDQSSNCINDNSGFWQSGPTYSPVDNSKYQAQTSSYWETDIYCRDAGATIPVTMILDKVYDTSHSILRHFNTGTNTYSTISGATFSTVTIGGTPKTAVSYSITEGGPLDPDGTADGFIHDPVALVAVAESATVPGAPNAGVEPQASWTEKTLMAATGFLIIGLLGYGARRYRRQLF